MKNHNVSCRWQMHKYRQMYNMDIII